MARVILTFSQYHFIPTKKIKLKYDDKNYNRKDLHDLYPKL